MVFVSIFIPLYLESMNHVLYSCTQRKMFWIPYFGHKDVWSHISWLPFANGLAKGTIRIHHKAKRWETREGGLGSPYNRPVQGQKAILEPHGELLRISLGFAINNDYWVFIQSLMNVICENN